ncbi:Fc.00g025860.m01.CDS01 [Cosmosporella sp. VM-42]
MEVAGLAIGAVSLLAGFAGAVDGYRLLCDVFAKDNGLRSLAADWHVEKVRFKRWGEHFRTDAGSDCLLHLESELVRGAIGRVMAEIMTLQQQTIPKLKKYDIADLPVPKVVGPSDEAFKESSNWVKKIQDQRNKIKQVKRVSWAIQDKDELQGVVNELKKRNDQLWSLVQASEADRVRSSTAMLQSIKSHQENEISLLAIQQQITANPDSLLAISFHLKELQDADPSKIANQATRLTANEITAMGSQTTASSLALGFYSPRNGLPRDAFMEWKGVEATNPAKNQIIQRIQALGALLSLRNTAEFRRPTCIGIFDDQIYEERTKGNRRIAFVYELPSKTDSLPISLSYLLTTAKKTKHRPPLGQRFLLAYRLATAISLFHASDWIHKALRADNVLFAAPDDVASPLIAGFQYSRPVGDASLEMRPTGNPETDFYYHPNVISGWTKLMDIYSLGILLWEIANWRPAFEERFRRMNTKQVASCLLDELQGEDGMMWDGLVGDVYMNVVRRCLKGDFGVVSGIGEQEAKVLGTKFFLKVVKELERCKA